MKSNFYRCNYNVEGFRRHGTRGKMNTQKKTGYGGDRNGKSWTKGHKRLKNQRYKESRRKGYAKKYGCYVKEYRKYKINKKIGTGKIKIFKTNRNSRKSNNRRKRIKNRRNKKHRKGKGYSFENCNYSQRNRRYRKNRKIHFHNRNCFRRKKKGKKSGALYRKGKTENSRCKLNKARMQMKLTKQFVSSLIYNRLKRKQKLQGCRRPEWYNKKFGADVGFGKWMQCVKMEWKKIGITVGGYERKRQFIKCECDKSLLQHHNILNH